MKDWPRDDSPGAWVFRIFLTLLTAWLWKVALMAHNPVMLILTIGVTIEIIAVLVITWKWPKV